MDEEAIYALSARIPECKGQQLSKSPTKPGANISRLKFGLH
jgi:hypothetical protein